MKPRSKPPTAAWRSTLLAVSRLRKTGDAEQHARLVAAVRGREGRAWFEALIASVQARHDHGVYEGTYNALWRFPPEQAGAWLATDLLEFQRRMGKHDQVHRFYLPITRRGKARKGFVRGVGTFSAADRKKVIAILRRWSIENEDWEPVLAELGAPVARPQAASEAPTEWPATWRRFLAEVQAGKRDMTSAWGATGRVTALPQVIALLTIDLGSLWREVDYLTNPLFISYAKPHYPVFLKQVRALPPDQRERLLANIKRAAPRKHRQLAADLAGGTR